MRPTDIMKNAVGTGVYTKAVESSNRNDVNGDYKYSEGNVTHMPASDQLTS